MSKKLGNLIREARTKKGFTQADLAAQVDGLSSAALGKAERGEAEPTEEQVRAIAKALGVTQTSLVGAMSGKGASKTAAKSSSKAASSKTAAEKAPAKKATSKSGTAKAASAKTGSAKTASAKTGSAKTTSAKTSSAKTSSAKSSAGGSSIKVTYAEKRLVELYRAADSDTKKAVISLLKGETPKAEDIVGSILGSAINILTGKDSI